MAQDPNNDNQPDRLQKSRYSKKYPFNQTWVTESGHEFHVDDTPGHERIRLAHKSGTFIEMTAQGKKVELNVGHSQQYIKGGHTLTVDKNLDEKVGGSHRMNVSGHRHEEIRGTLSQAIQGNHKQIIGGDHTQVVQGDHTVGVVGDQTVKHSGNSNTKIDGTYTLIVDGKGEEGINSGSSGFAYTIQVSDGGMNIFTKGKMQFIADQDIILNSGQDIQLQAAGKIMTLGTTLLNTEAQQNLLVVDKQGTEFKANNVFAAVSNIPEPPD